MSEEKIKILDMLKDGKITTDEALTLLKQVQDEDETRSFNHRESSENREYSDRREYRDRRQPYSSFRPDLSWLNGLRNVVEDNIRTVMEEASNNMPFRDEFAFGARQEKFTADSQNVGNGIRALLFEGKNAPMRLEAYDGDRLKADVIYKPKGNWDPHFALTEENGIFSLSYDDNALYMLGITIRVPKNVSIGEVCLKNKNSPICVDDIKAEKFELITKNSPIKVSDISGGYLLCESKNAPVTLDDVKMREIDVQTSHSKITLNDVEASHARLITSNAKIDVKDSNIIQLYAKSSNTPLHFDNLNSHDHESVRSIEAITSNGSITVRLPHRELQCKFRASTTNGGISCDLQNLEYSVKERNYAEAQTRGYEAAENKINLNLQTSNGEISIR